MKKNLLSILAISLGLFLCSSLFAQLTATNWADVIAEEKGDIVVVKGYESSGFFNTLLTAVKGDTTATGERTNPNRIYETIPGETYISDVTLELDATVPLLHITAPLPDAGVKPPLHIRANKGDGTFDKTFFQSPGSTLMENQYFLHATINETFDREFMRCQGIGSHHEYHNCFFELTNWTHHVPMANRQTYKYIDCKFINVGNEATLEKGCVLETRTLPPDTVWFENCTYINGGILVLGLETTGPMFVYFNHNTVVNVSQPPLCFPSAAEMVVTNNLFVNAGFVADYPDFYPLFDDDDKLPKGIINIDTMENIWIQNWYLDADLNSFYPVAEADRKVLFDKNSVWWDPRFETMVNSQMPAIPAEIGPYQWMSQMILMNDRTQAMFDDNASYTYLNEGTNISIQPDFVTNEDLVDEWVSYVITNSTPGSPNGGDLIPKWRTHLTSEVYTPDWPMLANLTYSDATLKSAGYYGLPLGDLNWFPDAKETWKGKGEKAVLIDALKSGSLPMGINDNRVTDDLMLSVYPNPFSKATTAKYELRSGANVKLNIYNLVGERVRSTDLGYQLAGSHNVALGKGNLTSGMYILQIITDNAVGITTKITVK